MTEQKITFIFKDYPPIYLDVPFGAEDLAGSVLYFSLDHMEEMYLQHISFELRHVSLMRKLHESCVLPSELLEWICEHHAQYVELLRDISLKNSNEYYIRKLANDKVCSILGLDHSEDILSEESYLLACANNSQWLYIAKNHPNSTEKIKRICLMTESWEGDVLLVGNVKARDIVIFGYFVLYRG